MFEDETVDINCPKCGHINTIAVREFERQSQTHFVCEGCQVRVKVEAGEFHNRLDQLRKEVEELEREAHDSKKPKRSRKDDFQI
ncbi:MAG TPA: hypothetical protein VJX23_08115 [Candidatus Binataceae bacterium]|nr:hypothetical protein [Candidatus Binataceae bacterium]